MIPSALVTDFYQLTMLQGYFRHGMVEEAAFEFFCRKLPARRNFLVAAGLEQVLDFLEGVCFTADEIAYLRSSGLFGADFLDWLAELRFTGEVAAVPEGTVLFADEPLLRVVAPLPEAQLVETRIINILHFQTLVASKAARMVLAAPGKTLVDFGLRRAHGGEAGIWAARAAYLAGFAGTSTVAAGRAHGIPIFGTMAHSFVQAHDDEAEAFRRFAASQDGPVVLLIDTYDTMEGARKVVDLVVREGVPVRGVRIDSGDLGELARRVRRLFDEAGLPDLKIFVSGNLDEDALLRLADAPIDGYGLGTRLDTSADAPYLDCVYKLQEYAGRPRRKRSPGKTTWPGRKQVYRLFDADGRMTHDILTTADDRTAVGTPLLQPVMRGGRRIAPAESLDAIRARVADQLARLPEPVKDLTRSATLPVRIGPALVELAAAC